MKKGINRRVMAGITSFVLVIGFATAAHALATSWYAVRTPSNGWYQECGQITSPYWAYGGLAGATTHYYSPTNNCTVDHVAMNRAQYDLAVKIMQYNNGNLLSSDQFAWNADQSSYAVGWDSKIANSNICTTFGGDFQEDLQAFITNEWGGSC